MGYNRAILMGNLGDDPELRYTANGKAVCTFRIAVNERERTEWFSVVAWEKLAETCGQYLEKGKEVLVEGRLQTRSWDGPDGAKRYRTEVVANVVQFSRSGRRLDNEGLEPVESDDLPFDI